jgi:outer membrane lipoprotein SlyB
MLPPYFGFSPAAWGDALAGAVVPAAFGAAVVGAAEVLAPVVAVGAVAGAVAHDATNSDSPSRQIRMIQIVLPLIYLSPSLEFG